MRITWLKMMLIGVGLMVLTPFAITARDLSAPEVMQNNFQVSKIDNMKSVSTLVLYNEAGQTRVRKTQGVTKLQKNQTDYQRMIRFVEPADVKGTGMLTIEHTGGDDDVWIYLPALKKSRRIVAAEKSNSFMGTEFSYSDILSTKVADYQYQFLEKAVLSGADCFVVEAVPANAKVLTETGYRKKIYWIRQDNFVEVQIEYYDRNNRLLKTLTTENITEVDSFNHNWLPLKKVMLNHQTKRKTVMELTNVKVNAGVSDDFFTLRYLEKAGL